MKKQVMLTLPGKQKNGKNINVLLTDNWLQTAANRANSTTEEIVAMLSKLKHLGLIKVDELTIH